MVKISEQELRERNEAQIKEIQKYKWIESEKEGHDIGELRASLEWISKYSKNFHESRN